MLVTTQRVLFLFALLSAQRHASDGFVLPSPPMDEQRSLACMKCNTAVTYIHKLISSGASEEELESTAISICMGLKMVPDDVCVDMVKLAAPQVIFVLNTTRHNSKTICNTLFGLCKSKLPAWSLKIPGGKPEVVAPVLGNSTYRILHLSDTHYEPEYTEGAPSTCDYPFCCRVWPDDSGSNATHAGRWGAENGRCDPPLRTLEAALQAAVPLKPDLIYVTGDLSPHVVWMLDEDDIRASVVDTAEVIRRYFPTTPVAYALGNHESVPVNSFPVPAVYPDGYDMDWLYPLLASVWGDGGVPDSAMDTILKGGYYHWSPVPGLRVVSINANYGFHDNW